MAFPCILLKNKRPFDFFEKTQNLIFSKLLTCNEAVHWFTPAAHPFCALYWSESVFLPFPCQQRFRIRIKLYWTISCKLGEIHPEQFCHFCRVLMKSLLRTGRYCNRPDFFLHLQNSMDSSLPTVCFDAKKSNSFQFSSAIVVFCRDRSRKLKLWQVARYHFSYAKNHFSYGSCWRPIWICKMDRAIVYFSNWFTK